MPLKHSVFRYGICPSKRYMRLVTLDLAEEFIDWFLAAPFDRGSDYVADDRTGHGQISLRSDTIP